MTEKRFKLDSEVGFIDTQKCGGDTMTLFEVVVELNKLNEENKQLKMGINSLKLLVQNWEALDEEKDEQLDRQNQALKKLKKENEKLKQNCKNYEWYKQYKAVLNENEQLKEKIDKLEGMLINNGLM